MHSLASLHLASLRLKWHDPQVCAVQCLSDPIHRPVTTHALRKETLLSSQMDRRKLLGMGGIHRDLELSMARSRKKNRFLVFGLD